MPDYIEPAYYDPEIEDPGPDPWVPARDRRPEYVQYRDDGCELAPKCLSCPLPKCQYDDAGWLDRKARKRRDREILKAWRKERPKKKALAARFGLTRRTIHRILKEAQPESVPSPSVIPASEPESIPRGGAAHAERSQSASGTGRGSFPLSLDGSQMSQMRLWRERAGVRVKR